MHDPDEALEFYANWIYDDQDWDRELELQSRQIQREADIRHGWRSPSE